MNASKRESVAYQRKQGWKLYMFVCEITERYMSLPGSCLTEKRDNGTKYFGN